MCQFTHFSIMTFLVLRTANLVYPEHNILGTIPNLVLQNITIPGIELKPRQSAVVLTTIERMKYV